MRRVQREDENVPDTRGRESNADTDANAREEIAVFAFVSLALFEIVVRETTGVSDVSGIGVTGGRQGVGEKTERERGRAVAKVTARITAGVHSTGSTSEIRRANGRGEESERGESEKGEGREWWWWGTGERRRRNRCSSFVVVHDDDHNRSGPRSATHSRAEIRTSHTSSG